MPPEAKSEGTADEWLRRAKSNLAKAKQRKPKEAYWEDLCFDAQQAVEKAVKAVLTHRGIEFRKIHDIGELLSLLDQSGEKIPQDFWRADDLTPYAVETRYPSPAEPVTQKEYREAVKMAEHVIQWAQTIISGRRR